MDALRIALLNLRLVMRTKAALFFTFLFPLVFLFVYAGLFAHGSPKFVAYMFGPVVTLNIMGSAFWGLGLQSVVQRERGILRRYRLAPISSRTIVVGNLVANYLLELPTIALLVFCAKVFFHMPLNFGWITLLVLVTIGTFGFAGFGLTIASVANTMQEAQIYNNVIWLTLLFLSGTTVPLPLLPRWIQHLATFLPATYLVSSFQAVMVQAEPLVQHWAEMVVLVISGVFGLLFAWKLFRWEKDERIPTRAKAWSVTFVVPFVVMGFWMNLYENPTRAWGTTYSLLSRGFGASNRSDRATIVTLENFEYPRVQASLSSEWQASAGARDPVRLSIISPGANSTAHALRIEGRLDSQRSATVLSIQRTFITPAGTAEAHSVDFWVRGDGSRAFEISVKPEGSNGAGTPALRLVPPADWTRVELPVALPKESRTGGGQRAPLVLGISPEGTAGNFYLEVDEITLE